MNVAKFSLPALLVVLTVSIGRAADPDDLRALVEYPTLEGGSSLQFNPTHGFFPTWNAPSSRAELEECTRRLKGTIEDAETVYRMAELYSDLDKKEKSREHYQKAMDLFAKRLEAEPKNGWLVAQHANAWYQLASDEKQREADTSYRRAVELSPEDWRCWMALGEFFQKEGTGEALKLLNGKVPQDKQASTVEVVQKWQEQANIYYDRAEKLAPNEPRLFVQRAYARAGQGANQLVMKKARGEKFDFLADVLTSGCVADLWRVSQLRPGDCRALTVAVMVQQMALNHRPWSELPPETQDSFTKARDVLETLARNADPHVAAEATETLGIFLKTIWDDEAKAEEAFRRATTLDPTRPVSWYGLLAILCRQARKDAAVKMCEEMVRRNDTVLSRLTLACCYQSVDRLAAANEQIQNALAHEPKSAEAHIAQAVMLIKYGEGKQASAAEQHLQQAGEVIESCPSKKVQSCYCLVQGVSLALRGDEFAAKLRLREALKFDASNENAKKALQLLGSESR